MHNDTLQNLDLEQLNPPTLRSIVGGSHIGTPYFSTIPWDNGMRLVLNIICFGAFSWCAIVTAANIYKNFRPYVQGKKANRELHKGMTTPGSLFYININQHNVSTNQRLENIANYAGKVCPNYYEILYKGINGRMPPVETVEDATWYNALTINQKESVKEFVANETGSHARLKATLWNILGFTLSFKACCYFFKYSKERLQDLKSNK